MRIVRSEYRNEKGNRVVAYTLKTTTQEVCMVLLVIVLFLGIIGTVVQEFAPHF